MTAKKYRHKCTHEIVEAIQFDGDNEETINAWIDSLYSKMDKGKGMDIACFLRMTPDVFKYLDKNAWIYSIIYSPARVGEPLVMTDDYFKTYFEPLEEEEPPKTPIDILNDALTEVDAVMKKYDLIGLVNLADKHGNGACGEKVDASWTPFILEDDKSYAIQKDWETEDICILHKAFMRLYSLDFRNGRTIRRVMNALLTHAKQV